MDEETSRWVDLSLPLPPSAKRTTPSCLKILQEAQKPLRLSSDTRSLLHPELRCRRILSWAPGPVLVQSRLLCGDLTRQSSTSSFFVGCRSGSVRAYISSNYGRPVKNRQGGGDRHRTAEAALHLKNSRGSSSRPSARLPLPHL